LKQTAIVFALVRNFDPTIDSLREVQEKPNGTPPL
jgi:hypothetical protein